jgi:DNA (cytosine-5)-methyltransferase 1
MKTISLFSGAMGLDLGLEKAGFETGVCVEFDKEAVNTIRFNRPELPVFNKSIVDVKGADLIKSAGLKKGSVPLVVGGPPCQAFSVFGNRLGIEDARGQLIFEFLRIVDEAKPYAFLMENVRGLLSMAIAPKPKNGELNPDVPKEYYEPGSLLRLVFKQFNEIGYNVNCFVVNSVNYGAPQIRERVLVIGNRFGYNVEFPQPQFSNRKEDNLPTFNTLGDIIGPDSNFIDPFPEVMNFSPRKLNYLSMVPAGGNWRSLPIDIQKESMGKSWYLKGGRSAYWRKLSFNFPSPTVVTMPNHAGTSMCHPTELRAVSVGEAAAIQEFPRDWIFQGNTTSKFRQIGNAVPTKLGEVAGHVLADLINKIETMGKSKNPVISYSVEHLRPHVRTRTFFKNGQSFAGDVDYYSEEEEVDNQLKLF